MRKISGPCLIASAAAVVGKYKEIFCNTKGIDCGGQIIPLRNKVGKQLKNAI